MSSFIAVEFYCSRFLSKRTSGFGYVAEGLHFRCGRTSSLSRKGALSREGFSFVAAGVMHYVPSRKLLSFIAEGLESCRGSIGQLLSQNISSSVAGQCRRRADGEVLSLQDESDSATEEQVDRRGRAR